MRIAAAVVFLLAATACSKDQAPPATPPSTTATAVSHVGTHGMVIFGSGEHVYLSHIPMYMPPHDLQLLMEISTSLPKEQQTFGERGFTVQPSAKWALDELAEGKLKSFVGTIYDGNFESGGKPVHKDVKIDVKRVLFSNTMSKTMPKSTTLEYFALEGSSPSEAFLVHLISAPPSFDHIVKVKPAGPLATGTKIKIEKRANEVTARIKGKVDPGPIEVVAELSCLGGDDFSEACPP